MTALAPTPEALFIKRLIAQKRACAHTVASYLDAFRLLLVFARRRTGKAPSTRDIADHDAPLIPLS